MSPKHGMQSASHLFTFASNHSIRKGKRSMLNPRTVILKAITFTFFCLAFLFHAGLAQAATFNVANGDVAGLIAAINAANASPAPNTINLASGGTYTLTAVDNGVNGLPAITNSMTINGNGTTIQRSSAAGTPDFRIFHVLTNDTVTFSGLTISNGTGTGPSTNNVLGGGIFNRNSGTVNVINCVIFGNSANYGGGIDNVAGILNLINSTISGNSIRLSTDDLGGPGSGGHGGGINIGDGTANIINSTISNNSALGGGGGIFQYAGTVKITNSTITGNSCSGAGGGIHHNDGGTTDVTNSTIVGNSSGVYNNGSHGGSATLRNTIVALNSVGDLQGFITSYGHNLVGNGSVISPQAGDQFGVTATQLELGPLSNNGGPTQTIPLLCGSVAIDAGDDAVLDPPLGLTIDQRGDPRKFGANVDIGAFESVITCNPATGPQGPQGPAGPQGPKGDTGDKGDKGDTGAQGPKGDTGATGAQGTKGDTGSQGVAGPQGAQGEKGDKGDKGDQGIQGLKGDTGAAGATGPQGTQGDAGPQGSTGPQGVAGAKGDKGDKGDAGATGAQGAQGAIGPKGDTGATGSQGLAGPVGPQGPQGVPGLSGLQYITGTPLTLLWQATGTATATCPAGLKVISGGYDTTVPTGSLADQFDIQVFSSRFSGTGGWSVKAKNSAHADNASLVLTAYAVCAVVQ